MTRIAIVLIAMLLVACASPPAQQVADGLMQPPSSRRWQHVLSGLVKVPDRLQQALAAEAEVRLQAIAPANGSDTTPTPSSREWLMEFLREATHPALLPDERFERLTDVVVGTNRSPLAYATALTDYLSQPDLVCEQPLYAAYFQQRYAAGQRLVPCDKPVPFSVISRLEGGQVTRLDPRRVKSIHLLFAGQSGEWASRFGHVALRLVVCPVDNDSEAACDANLFEHVVLGFQAHIDDFSLNTLKALAGDYKAYLFANPFMDVYEQYAIGEFREVYSLPLKLDSDQREVMVRELADIHWRYGGKYNFFSRNCATILQDALRTSWPAYARDEQMQSTYLRPDRMFAALRRTALVDGHKLDSLELAERTGHFFSSTRAFYDQALSDVRAAMLQPEFTDLEGYLKIPPAQRLASIETDVRFSKQLANNAHLREAQIMLEEYAVLRSMRALMVEAAKYVEQQDLLARADLLRDRLDAEHARVFDDCLLTPIRQQMEPVRRLKGVPSAEDIQMVDGSTTFCRSMEGRQLLQETIASIGTPGSAAWQQLMTISRHWGESINNVNALKKM